MQLHKQNDYQVDNQQKVVISPTNSTSSKSQLLNPHLQLQQRLSLLIESIIGINWTIHFTPAMQLHKQYNYQVDNQQHKRSFLLRIRPHQSLSC